MSNLQTIIAAEEAKRAELEGRGKDKAWFEQNRKNYLVEAGAGAGKTFIMVQRIVNQLVAGIYEPEDVVAITFTNKSTLELQERLDKQLADRREKLLEKQRTAGALSEEDLAVLKRLEYLIQESGRMQVSTIHSFCNTMLQAMPFSSPLGLDMELLEDEDDLALDFLARKLRQNPLRFQKARNLGYYTRLLQKDFVARCQNNEAEIFYLDANQNPKDVADLEVTVLQKAKEFHKDLHNAALKPGYLEDGFLNVIYMSEQDFGRDPKAVKQLIWSKLTHADKIPTRWKTYDGWYDSKLGRDWQAIWLNSTGKALYQAAGELLHSYVMTEMVPLLAEYREEKLRTHKATFNDLLLRARDMLRDDADARAYFHQRYKVLYVDEMQDTDPVQAEFLFYLTSDPDHFNGDNWQECKPVPGSLFLVGDPKQAIYRFRGADIGVYNTLLDLFRGDEEGSVGEKVTLQFNFRSAEEICRLSDEIFDPSKNNTGTTKPCNFVGGQYHAAYVPMIARSGSCPRARTVYYQVGDKPPQNDPKHVAAFIRAMIDTKAMVGIHNPDFGRVAHPAQPKDFLILTSGKTHLAAYSTAISELGIPVQVTGEQTFGDVGPIAMAVLHLESLLELRSDQMLVRVLQNCYAVEMQTIDDFLQIAGEHSITGVANQSKLKKIRRALDQDQTQSQKVKDLCAALEEIAELRTAVKREPAMVIIERLLEGGYGVWCGESHTDVEKRRRTYSRVQQYLNVVRKATERSFPALAAYAVACAEKDFKQELDLEPAENAVRVMNLHKAKGLEAEVVILAASWKMPRVPNRQVIRNGNQAVEHVALIQKGSGDNATEKQIGFPTGWAAHLLDEAKYQDAEYARLLYVAATRAKTMLVVFERDPSASSFQKKNLTYWDPIREKIPAADALDPDYGEAFRMLYPAKPGAAASTQQPQQVPVPQAPAVPVPPVPQTVALQPDLMEADLQKAAAALAQKRIYPVTPSGLDKDKHPKKPTRDDNDPESPKIAAKPVQDADIDGTITVKVDTVTPIVTSTMKPPYGPDWGTMVHRVMELCVLEGSYTATYLEKAARQAVREQLEAGIEPGHMKMLGLAKDADEQTIIDTLVPQIEVAAAFITSDFSPLCQLLKGAEAYPELPFMLQAREDDPQNEALYRHLTAHISSKEAAGRTLALTGTIDLAVCKDGAWYVVDYKTDQRRSDESDADFAQRLRDEYTPQIATYARVLERMGGTVKGAYLCSIPANGQFIPLDI